MVVSGSYVSVSYPFISVHNIFRFHLIKHLINLYHESSCLAITRLIIESLTEII